jgi:hypothetical protein
MAIPKTSDPLALGRVSHTTSRVGVSVRTWYLLNNLESGGGKVRDGSLLGTLTDQIGQCGDGGGELLVMPSLMHPPDLQVRRIQPAFHQPHDQLEQNRRIGASL